MRLRYPVIFFFALFCTVNIAFGQTVIKASDFGVKANSLENAAPGIRKAVEACKANGDAVLLLPGGRIDVWPEGAVARELYISNGTEDDTLSKVKSIAFAFEQCHNITLDGNNTLVVLHGKMVSFAVLNSVNVRIKNVRFDYERPTISELTIRSVTDTAIETVIHPDSRYAIDSGRISFYGEGWKTRSYHTVLFDPIKQTMRYSTFKPFLEAMAVETSPFRVRFEGRFANSGFRAGDVLTFRDPYRDNCGGLISRSRNIELENVTMHFMHGLGIVSQFSENISLFKVAVAPRENSGRVIASFADCFHFSGCRGLVKIDSCLTLGSQDDPVNVHGTHLKITAVDEANKVRVRFMHHQTYGFEAFFAGDSIAFINPKTLLPVGYAVVKNARLINKREMELELNVNLPGQLKMGDCIENLTWTPEVVIRNSRFERTNTRGILVTTRRKVLIENNTFFRTGMHAILIANDAAGWFESGPVQDVTIRNNRFEDCGYNSTPGNYVIAIAPENHELVPGKYVHRNIRIESNLFKVYDTPLLTARSVDGLVFTNNTIERSTLMKGDGNQASIKLTACNNVLTRNNAFHTGWKTTVSMQSMNRKQVNSNVSLIEVKTKKEH